MNWKSFIPILDWLPHYKKANLSDDLAAGLTVGVMLIPQGMAYAMIAGLPPAYGLYAAIVPQLVYALFGSSRQLSVGPVAMDSLLVATSISTIAVTGTEHYIALATLLSLLMGAIQVFFGFIRLGFLVNFLSKPVISGFTSAAALIIGFHQLKHILGLEIPQGSSIFTTTRNILLYYTDINWIAVIIATTTIAIIKNVKKIHKTIPGALVAVVLATTIVSLGGLTNYGINIIGTVPKGLPSFSIPILDKALLIELIPMALTLAFIAFMESISVAKAIQAKHKDEYQLNNNQELIGLGMGNIVGSFFACYPTTGGFSRSAVNEQAGAKTSLAAIISALLVALTLLFLMPLFYNLPTAVLGAIIMVAIWGLIDIRYPSFLWKTSREDFYMLFITFSVTLILGIKEGIGAGVTLSLVMLVYRSTKPHIAILGKLPDTKDYRNIDRFKKIEIRKDVIVLRHDAPLFFANILNFIETIKQTIRSKQTSTQLLVIHCGSISNIDATALQELKVLIIDLEKEGTRIAFSGIIGPVRDFLHKANFIDEVGETHFFIDVQSAIDYFDSEGVSSTHSFQYATQTNVFKEKEV